MGAVARRAAGQDLSVIVGGSPRGVQVAATVEEALSVPCDVLIDFTSPGSVKSHALHALGARVNVVIGTSGLTSADYAEIEKAALASSCGVIAAGNFSITAALLLRFATEAARHVGSWEVVDYASLGKPDAPSGTARELAERLDAVGSPAVAVPVEETLGAREARGAAVGTTQVHSLRLPSFSVSTEIVFGGDDERLSIRQDAGSTPAPYVAGTLLAIRAVPRRVGVTRGLDQLL